MQFPTMEAILCWLAAPMSSGHTPRPSSPQHLEVPTDPSPPQAVCYQQRMERKHGARDDGGMARNKAERVARTTVHAIWFVVASVGGPQVVSRSRRGWGLLSGQTLLATRSDGQSWASVGS
ncbi:hypothetical protein ACQY0O_000428 [Thecaphora frezii]